MAYPQILVVPFPAQGHINPLMQISHKLTEYGCKITFLHTDFNLNRVLASMANDEKRTNNSEMINLVSIPDGLGPDEDRNDVGRLCQEIMRSMPARIEELINNINALEKGSGKIVCVIADGAMAWVMELAAKMGIRGAVFWPQSAALFDLLISTPKLIHDGVIDSNGFPIKKQPVQLWLEMPLMDSKNFPWLCNVGDSTSQKLLFEYFVRFVPSLHLADKWLCNSLIKLEPGAFSMYPKIQPIGPLTALCRQPINLGNQLWPEDSDCLSWLDQKPTGSVIYIAFGSFTLFDHKQFQELALALEFIGRPFLWVVRPGSYNHYPKVFKGALGKITGWTPQGKVLSHPAIACFVSHCGWNSTMEGVSNGVPFLCWPYFSDQIFNRSYICDVWKVGLRFDKDQDGIISKMEIKKKVEQLLGDEGIKERCAELKDKAMTSIKEGGVSMKNLERFVEWIKT